MIPQLNGEFVKTGETAAVPNKIYAWGKRPLLEVFSERLKASGQSAAVYMGEVFKGGRDNECRLVLCLDKDRFTAEGAYELTIESRAFYISASDDCGLAYGLTTLFVMIRDGGGQLCCGKCTDIPAHVYRGFMLDVSRHFFTADTVKDMIEQAALRRMNRLHWHLSDDQGYRLESTAFPKLNETASYRDDVISGPHYGGYYTKQEVKEIISYAKARGMEIIPEIDMPGHIMALLAAYPHLACREEPVWPASCAGIFERILCAGSDEVLRFVKELLDEVCSMFPYDYVHIGGDEVPKNEWKACPKCQERIRQLGLRDEEELQAWFTKQAASYLIAKGKKPVCWNDALRSGTLDERIVIQYWEEADEQYCGKALAGDRKWIYSFTPHFYFDYSPALCPMKKAAAAEPVLAGGQTIPADQLLGYECTLWSEHIFDRERLEYLAFPRMYAAAELGWNGGIDLSRYDSFQKRCEKEIEAARKQGIHAASIEEADPDKEQRKASILKEWKTRLTSVSFLGEEDFRPVIYDMIRSKLRGEMPQDEIEELIRNIDGQACGYL